MRGSSVLAAFLILASCGVKYNSDTTSAGANIYRMSQICLGMTENQVLEIMDHPVMNEEIVTSDANYEIWFYVTRTPAPGQDERVLHHSTPLIFKDGVLVGRGYDYYNHLLTKQVSMCSKPPPEKKAPPPPSKPAEKADELPPDQDKEYRWNKEDDRMIEQGEEQNFNYW